MTKVKNTILQRLLLKKHILQTEKEILMEVLQTLKILLEMLRQTQILILKLHLVMIYHFN